MKDLDKRFNHKEAEPRIYKTWEKSGFFNPETCVAKGVTKKNAPVFSMVLPPPNVTGVLHIGHAFEGTLQDIMVRYNRMRGKRTLWIPGTDHAAIATQAKVEKELYENEKKTRQDLGREEFLKQVEIFAKQSHDTIIKQIKTLGNSLDWKREAYTLDTKREKAVRTAFKRMYDEGIIYRGERIVNWDPRLQTTVSDDEVERLEKKDPFYYFKYGPFTISTARPETKFGDKYVVMHPADTRYKNYKHGQKIELEWITGKITATVIKDKAVDMDFGTGVMTITPWHDATDFDIAERHNLDKEQIIGYDGKLLAIAEEFSSMHITKARPLIVEKLKQKGLLERVEENYVHSIATNSRGGGVIEPQIMRQWFIDVNKKFTLPYSNIKGVTTGKEVTLKKLMQTAVKNGQIEILPARFKKIYFHWINNLRDWCISRQIWYGHQIPVYYCSNKLESISKDKFLISKKIQNRNDKNFDTFVSTKEPKKCPFCGTCKMQQDPDTLDTWFSSGLWTFSTLNWPNKTEELKTYHPTSMMAPGYEILFFWVARMILMSTYLLGDIPFKTVLLHGMVRDEQGRKFSKSLGNGIDPIELVAEYGADASRMSLIVGSTPGRDLPFSVDKVRGYRNFTTKLWNVTRFLLMNLNDYSPNKKVTLNNQDKKIKTEFKKLTEKVTHEMECYRYSQAAELLYHYAWHTFADKIIEESKKTLQGNNIKKRASRQYVLIEVWAGTLKMLHPFMPFVTEELYGHLPIKNKKLLIVTNWPNN